MGLGLLHQRADVQLQKLHGPADVDDAGRPQEIFVDVAVGQAFVAAAAVQERTLAVLVHQDDGGRRRGIRLAVHPLDVDAGRGQVGDLFHRQILRGGVNYPGLRDEAGGIAQPGGIPERRDFTGGLIARAGAAIKILERWRVEQQGAFHRLT